MSLSLLERDTAARARDPYPTRHDRESILTPRLDPVVYGTAEDGPLDQQSLDRYAETGYLVLRDVLDSAALQSAATALDGLWQRQDDGPEDPRAVREPDSQALRSIFAVHEQDRTLADLFLSSPLTAIARQLLGDEVYLHQSRANLKPGLDGREFMWHSDFETWHSEDGMPAMRAVSCSISLTESSPYNGCLLVMPGSHKLFIGCVGETPEDHYKRSLRSQEIGVPDANCLRFMADEHGIADCAGPPGSVIFFDCNLLHGSNGNITPFDRRLLFGVFNAVSNRLEEPYGGTARRPDYIAHRPDASA